MIPQIRSQLGARWEEVVSGSPRGRIGASWEGHPGVGHELSCCLEPPPQRDLFSGSQASLPRFQGHEPIKTAATVCTAPQSPELSPAGSQALGLSSQPRLRGGSSSGGR